jgi:hypothetical protein
MKKKDIIEGYQKGLIKPVGFLKKAKDGSVFTFEVISVEENRLVLVDRNRAGMRAHIVKIFKDNTHGRIKIDGEEFPLGNNLVYY